MDHIGLREAIRTLRALGLSAGVERYEGRMEDGRSRRELPWIIPGGCKRRLFTFVLWLTAPDALPEASL